MKTIGLIGGMSWESSLEYYRLINQLTRERLGGLHSAHCLLYSVDFAEVEALQHGGRWSEAGQCLARAARKVERGGAEFVLLCTNTMHKVAEAIQAAISIPLLHIADATAEAIRAVNRQRVGLLATRYTMEEDFYRARLTARGGVEVRVPEAGDRLQVHRIIYEELCVGRIREESRTGLRKVVDQMVAQGADGILLGCTELGLLLRPEDSPVPLFDTTRIHAQAAVDLALRP